MDRRPGVMERIQIASQAWYEDRTERRSVREVGALLCDDMRVGGAVGARIEEGLQSVSSVAADPLRIE